MARPKKIGIPWPEFNDGLCYHDAVRPSDAGLTVIEFYSTKYKSSAPLQGFHVDGVHKTDIVEWNKKRKSQSYQLDLHRPKHKCWIGNSSSEHDLMIDESPVSESMDVYVVEGRTDAAASLDDSSEPESAKDSNSFADDSNTSMSVNEEAVEKVCSGEEETFVDKEYDPSCHYADLHALKDLEEHFLGIGNCTDHIYKEYAKDTIEESIDKEFDDLFYSKGENPNTYVLSSGRWNVDQEAQSSTRPPTIDQEFEQYFSMLML